MKVCKNRNCTKEAEGRKHYCSSFCQYWEGVLKKDEEKYMPPKNKRNKDWFWMYIGSSYAKGQGKRVNGMITGGLTGQPIANFAITKTTKENLEKHFGNPCVGVATFGDGTRLLKQDFEEKQFKQTEQCK